jgi:hypothetical protein
MRAGLRLRYLDRKSGPGKKAKCDKHPGDHARVLSSVALPVIAHFLVDFVANVVPELFH